MLKSTALPRPPPASNTVSFLRDLGGRARWTHDHHRLALLEQRAEREEPPISSTIMTAGPRFGPSRRRSTRCPPSPNGCLQPRVASGLVVLKSVELAGLEVARRERRAHDHLGDGRGEADDSVHHAAQLDRRAGLHRPKRSGRARPAPRARAWKLALEERCELRG